MTPRPWLLARGSGPAACEWGGGEMGEVGGRERGPLWRPSPETGQSPLRLKEVERWAGRGL